MNENTVDKAENTGSPGARPDLKLMESGLLEMGKALRAISIYPAQHPQRANLLGQAYGALRVLLESLGDLSCRVTKGGFLVGEAKVGEKQTVITELAQEMHLRQIKSFSLRAELTRDDFISFLELIMEKPEQFRAGRFVEQWFKARRIETIWINEMDFSKIMTVMGALEEGDGEDAEGQAPASLEAQLEDTLAELETETDPEKVGQLLRQLEVLAQPLVESNEYAPLWWIVSSVAERGSREGSATSAEEAVRALTLRSVRALVTGGFLAHLLERYNRGHQDQAALGQVFTQIGAPVIDAVMGLVSRTESITVFRPLLTLAAEFGASGRPVLESYLTDENPLKVRRALLLLGEIRSRESVEAIRRLIDHPDDKVRRETIRALSLIRGIESSRALIAALQAERDPEVRTVIVSALGESKDLAAVPTLIKLLRGTSVTEDTTTLLETVAEALGRIGSLEALPALIKTLNKFSLFDRELTLRVRIKAALALGRLGGESSLQALARYARGKDHPLDQTCSAVLKALLANNGRPVDQIEELGV